MVHNTDEELRASITGEATRISSLDDTIAGTLNNILVYGSVGMIVASITFLKDIAGPHPAPGSLTFLKAAWILLVAAATASIISLLTSRKAR